MNKTLDNVFDTNLRKNFNYDELINVLNTDNIKEKHFAVLELEELYSANDAKLLASNLVGQDGKIREAVAFKINELTQNPQYLELFLSNDIFEILLEGIMDINGNVCRQIIGSKFFENNLFRDFLCKELPERITEIINKIKKLDLSAKQYVVSKRNFHLYWCLEALYNIIETVEFRDIKEIIFFCGGFYDYTIREKTAKILTKLDNPELNELKEKLMNDENYYVKRYMRS